MVAEQMEATRIATEVLIVGGGPAGLATGIALRRRGVDCVVVEALAPAIDKACGEGLMPDAIDALATLGVSMTERDGPLFRGIRFADSKHEVEAAFPRGVGIGVKRTHLHCRLAEGAVKAGVRVMWETRVKLMDRHTASLQNSQGVKAEINFRWVIGADGQASAVRRWAGLDAMRKESVRYGFRRHYQVAPWSDYVEVHWAAGCQLYITPVAADCVCVVLVARDKDQHRDDMLAAFPEIARRLGGAPIVSQQRGAVSATRKLRSVADENVALVGDASGSVDAVTGEGLAISFRQALAVADAIASGSLAAYGAAHERIGKLSHAMGALMLTMDRWPALESRALSALSSRPGIFRELLAVHVGARSVPDFILRDGPQLGWELLAARA